MTLHAQQYHSGAGKPSDDTHLNGHGHPVVQATAGRSLFLVLGMDMFMVSPLLPQISAGFGVSIGEASVVAWSFSLVYALLSPAVA